MKTIITQSPPCRLRRLTIAGANLACLIGLLAVFTGCENNKSTETQTTYSTQPAASNTPPAPPVKLSENQLQGLLLMDSVLKKQADIDKITILKTVRPEVKTLLEQIAKASELGSETVQDMMKPYGPKAEKTKINQPLMEDKAREGIENITSREIIFGSGNEVEFRLLSSQLQSARYVSQLAVMVSNETQGPDREKLRQLSEQFNGLYNQTFNIMIKAYKP